MFQWNEELSRIKAFNLTWKKPIARQLHLEE